MISDIIDTVSIIPLKEEPGNYIGGVYKLYVSNNKYIIFDWLNTHKINLYDNNGSFLKTIIKVGEGPNDALQLNDCWVNQNNELEVYDFAQKKIYQFDTAYTLRTVIKSNGPHLFKSLKRIPNSDKYVGYAAFNEYNPAHNGKLFHIALLDKELSIINTDSYFDKLFQGVDWLSYNEHFFPYQDTLRFVQAYDNYVYNVTGSGITKRYKIVYKKNALPDDVLPIIKKHLGMFKDRHIRPNEKSAILKDFVRFDGKWLESNNYIFLSSRDGKGEYGNHFFSLIDKKSNSILFNTRNFCETRRYKLLLPPFQYFDQKSQEFISVVNGNVLKNILYKDSNFLSNIISDTEVFYLIKVKLK